MAFFLKRDFMKKILMLDMENPLARHMARYFLDRGIEVLGVGTNEKVLGSLNSIEGFTFRKFDLTKSDFLRSYLYGIDSILIIDKTPAILEKLDHLYQCIIHLKSRVPQVLLLSNYSVFGESLKESYLEDDLPEPTTEDGKTLRGAEIIIENYTKHLETKGSVLRIPKMLSRKNDENEFTELFKHLSKSTRFVIDNKENFSLQWISKERLSDVCFQIFSSSWNDFEIFHTCDYENNIEEGFNELSEHLRSRSKIIQATKTEIILSNVMKLSSFLEDKLEDYVRETKSLAFLQVPRLNCEKTESFFEFSEYTWQDNISKKQSNS